MKKKNAKKIDESSGNPEKPTSWWDKELKWENLSWCRSLLLRNNTNRRYWRNFISRCAKLWNSRNSSARGRCTNRGSRTSSKNGWKLLKKLGVFTTGINWTVEYEDLHASKLNMESELWDCKIQNVCRGRVLSSLPKTEQYSEGVKLASFLPSAARANAMYKAENPDPYIPT